MVATNTVYDPNFLKGETKCGPRINLTFRKVKGSQPVKVISGQGA